MQFYFDQKWKVFIFIFRSRAFSAIYFKRLKTVVMDGLWTSRLELRELKFPVLSDSCISRNSVKFSPVVKMFLYFFRYMGIEVEILYSSSGLERFLQSISNSWKLFCIKGKKNFMVKIFLTIYLKLTML